MLNLGHKKNRPAGLEAVNEIDVVHPLMGVGKGSCRSRSH